MKTIFDHLRECAGNGDTPTLDAEDAQRIVETYDELLEACVALQLAAKERGYGIRSAELAIERATESRPLQIGVDDFVACPDCSRRENVVIQALFVGHGERLFVVTCRYCNTRLVPVVVPYFAPQEDVTLRCMAAWNNRAQSTRHPADGKPDA